MTNNYDIKKYITPLTPIATSLKQNGKLKNKIKCIIFDIYGTLFISGSGDIGLAIKNTNKNTKNLHLFDELFSKYSIEQPIKEIIFNYQKKIQNEHKKIKSLNKNPDKNIDYPEVDITKIWKDVLFWNDKQKIKNFAIEFEMIINPVYPMPNLKQVLLGCKNKVDMGIISNAQFYTPHLFNFFLNSNISEIGFNPKLTIFSYKYGIAKPSKELFNIAAKKCNNLEIPVESTLYVGNDMLNDIYPASCLGFQTALFAGDLRSLRLRKDCKKCNKLKPSLVITDLVQLLEYL